MQQIQAVIPQSRGDDLLIGDLLSLDIPTGPSTTYNAPSGVCISSAALLQCRNLSDHAVESLLVLCCWLCYRWTRRPGLSHWRPGWPAGLPLANKTHFQSTFVAVTLTPALLSLRSLLASLLVVVECLVRIPWGEEGSSSSRVPHWEGWDWDWTSSRLHQLYKTLCFQRQ